MRAKGTTERGHAGKATMKVIVIVKDDGRFAEADIDDSLIDMFAAGDPAKKAEFVCNSLRAYLEAMFKLTKK
jgi:hypothetical protein